MDKIWVYEDNVFLNVTDHRYNLMLILSTFHINALLLLSAIPFFKERYNFYKPLHDAFVTAYNAWKLSGGKQKSDTLTVNQLLALRTQKLNGWEPKITSVYLPGTPGYMNLFPQNRYPFSTGSKEQRIAAFKTLSDALGDTPALKDVQTDVLNYWQQLHDQSDLQAQSKGAKNNNSDDVEAALVAGCDGMFCNLGYTMAYYYQDRSRIGGLFDLENIRRHDQLVFDRQVKENSSVFVVKHKFAATDLITCENKGADVLHLYEGDSKTTPFSEAVSIAIPAGQTVTVEAGKIGAPDKAYLIVYNESAVLKGDCEIRFL